MWHKVSEALPPAHTKVIVRVRLPSGEAAYFEDRYRFNSECWEQSLDECVTHWTPLPETDECPTCGQKKPL